MTLYANFNAQKAPKGLPYEIVDPPLLYSGNHNFSSSSYHTVDVEYCSFLKCRFFSSIYLLIGKNIDGILSVHIKLSLPNIYIFPYCYLKVGDFISHSEDVG